MSFTETEAARERQSPSGATIQSVERAFRILEAISRHRQGARLSDISREIGLHVSTTFNLAKSLVALGCLRIEEDGKRYKIGRSIFALASASFDDQAMAEVALPLLRDLAQTTGESSHFAVWAGDEVLILARTQGSGAFQMAEHLGSLRPAYATAIGKALLSGLTQPELKGWMDRVPLEPLTEKTITDSEALLREIERVRSDSMAFDDGEYNPEARCLAAPVIGFAGRVIGSVGISGPIWRVSLHDIAQHSETVRAIARRLSEEFGHIPAKAPTQA